jgi:hypothetical protein
MNARFYKYCPNCSSTDHMLGSVNLVQRLQLQINAITVELGSNASTYTRGYGIGVPLDRAYDYSDKVSHHVASPSSGSSKTKIALVETNTNASTR